MKHLLFLLLATPATAQSVTWDFHSLNEFPCSEWLSPCDTSGCSVCNRPIDAPTFLGTNVVWTGVSECPHSDPSSDGWVVTSGWGIAPDSTRYVLASVIAFSPINVDSLIIRSRRSEEGPSRLLVKYSANSVLPTAVVADAYSDTIYTETVVTGLGCIEPDSGMVLGFAQVLLQPYLSDLGTWTVDEIRIVGSPCLSTSIRDISPRDPGPYLGLWNVLGQRVRSSQ